MITIASSLILLVANCMLMVFARSMWKSAKGELRVAALMTFWLFGLAALIHAGLLAELILKPAT